MPNAAGRVTRVAADPMDSAAAGGTRQSRPARQQLDHWARVSRAVSDHQTASRRRIEAAPAGGIGTDRLYGDLLSAQGVTTVALNDDGEIVGYRPDGAGKSTFIALTLAPLSPRSAFANADEIAGRRWPDDPATHSDAAARITADTRAKLIEAGYVVALHVAPIPRISSSHRCSSASATAAMPSPRTRFARGTAGYGSWSPMRSRSSILQRSTTTPGSTARGCRATDRGHHHRGTHVVGVGA